MQVKIEQTPSGGVFQSSGFDFNGSGAPFGSFPYVVMPPLGVIPRTIHREHRRNELLRAISEYINGGFVNQSNRATVLEWLDELYDIVEAEG